MGRLKRNSFVITTTNFGPMLANRYDYYRDMDGNGFRGVGLDLMEDGEHRGSEVALCLDLIVKRRRLFGDGVIVVDVGANIGTHTIPWARAMHDWGEVIAIEPQERIFYALAGNICMNNCFNARAIWAAATEMSGSMVIPVLDHQQPANFGGLSLMEWNRYDQPQAVGKVEIKTISIDDLKLQRLDFIKIDVQGMETDVLRGAKETITRCQPIIVIEVDHSTNDHISYTTIVGNRYKCRKLDDMNVVLEPNSIEK